MKIIYSLILLLKIISCVISVAQDCSIGGLKATSCNLKTTEYYFNNKNPFYYDEILNIPMGAKLYFSSDVIFKHPVNFNCQPKLKKEKSPMVYEMDCLQVFSNKTITYDAEEIYASLDLSTIFNGNDKKFGKPVEKIESFSRFMKPVNGFGKTTVLEPIIYSRIKSPFDYQCDFNSAFRFTHLSQDKYAIHSTCAFNKTLYPQGDFNVRITNCKLKINFNNTIHKINEIGLDTNHFIEKLNFTPSDGLFYNGTRDSIYIRYYPNFEKEFNLTTVQDIFDPFDFIIKYCENEPDIFEVSFGNQSDLWDHKAFNLNDYKIVKNVIKTFDK